VSDEELTEKGAEMKGDPCVVASGIGLAGWLLIVALLVLLVVAIVHRLRERSQACCLGGSLLIPLDSREARIHGFTHNSILLLLVLHYYTLGVYSFFWFCFAHRYMPRIRRDDPSVIDAIGRHGPPFYNIYWAFFHHLRLCDRINEQRAFHGLDQKRWLRPLSIVVNVLVLTAGGAQMVGQSDVVALSLLLDYVIVAPIYLVSVQHATNELAILTYMENLAEGQKEET
jgi:hypothetical protein